MEFKDIFWDDYQFINYARLASTVLSFLIFPAILLPTAVGLTLGIFLVVILFIAQVFRDEEGYIALELVALVLFFLISRYFFEVLASVVLFLYCFICIIFAVLQEWAFRIQFHFLHQEDFWQQSPFDFGNKKISLILQHISYFSIPFAIGITGYIFFDSEHYQALKKEHFISFFNLKEQIFNTNFLDMAKSNYENGLELAKGVLGKLIRILGTFFLAQTIFNIILRFFDD